MISATCTGADKSKQPYSIFGSDAWDLHLAFFAKGKELWLLEQDPETLLCLAALRLMDFAGAVGGLDLEARLFHDENHELGEKLGLRNGNLRADVFSATGYASDMSRSQAHIAWGYFMSAW